jgi:predicted GTPase
MGHCGNGKTSLINKICNKNYKVGVVKGTMTRDIVFEDVSYFPEGRFRIYDTPGTSSS